MVEQNGHKKNEREIENVSVKKLLHQREKRCAPV